MEYTNELAERICELIEGGELTLVEICEDAGITRAEFKQWKKERSEFKLMVAEAEDQRYENRLIMATRAQKRLIQGYTTIDEKIEYDANGIVLSRHQTKKFIPPSPSVVLHALRSLDVRYNQPDLIEHTSGGKPIRALPNIFISPPATAKSMQLRVLKNGTEH